jgi:hypothetical protein
MKPISRDERRPTGWLLIAVSAALIVSCHRSPQSEHQQLQRELDSWDATARLTRELSQRGALPPVYVRQVSEAVQQGRDKVHQRAAKISQ